MMSEQLALTAFNGYLNSVDHLEEGKPITRRNAWSIQRITFARLVWMNSRGFWL
jgi:hypothetical protein